MKLLNYIERKSLIHSLNGASKLFCLLMWICSTMITFNTPFLLGATILGAVAFRLSRLRLSEQKGLLYFLLSFLIPSTSGMAGVSMPIMGPLAQQLGFNPSVMVMTFCAASGVVNLITPTSGAIMGGLALSRIEYSTWVKFCTKIIVVMSIACMVVLTIAFMTL